MKSLKKTNCEDFIYLVFNSELNIYLNSNIQANCIENLSN